MPALFCFKRSRSEILMSQSPPDTFYTNRALGEVRAASASPTPSARSLTLRPASPASPRLAKVKFSSSPSDMFRMNNEPAAADRANNHYLLAVHRKQVRWEAYFLPWQRWRGALFGSPLVVRARAGASGRELYARVWAQLARLLARPPPRAAAHPNHAMDCDDSLGYEFPFTLRAVERRGAWCALCAWPALCRGCALPPDDRPLLLPAATPQGAGGVRCSPAARAKLARHHSARLSTDTPQEWCGGGGAEGTVSRLDLGMVRRGEIVLAVDWDPTALHLQYQSAGEKAWIEHSSVAASAGGARAVDLRSCLRAFTGEERLEARYHCAHCRRKQPATKKLQIWRAPPVMIIHLKRFQYVNNKWIKSQKVVNFPFEEFDPTPYLASVPRETIRRARRLRRAARPAPAAPPASPAPHPADELKDRLSDTDIDTDTDTDSDSDVECGVEGAEGGEGADGPCGGRRRARLQSASLAGATLGDTLDRLKDYHQHHLQEGQDPFDLKYRLYAVVSHSGQLSGGHYVAYVRNPTGAWLCYNDSMCREVPPPPRLDAAAAYLLFYERRGLRHDAYLPDVAARPPPAAALHALEPDDTELKKMCALM